MRTSLFGSPALGRGWRVAAIAVLLASIVAFGAAPAPGVSAGAAQESLCDGLDDNADGRIDEGFVDSDSDGIADCTDTDNDNDGVGDDDELTRGSNPVDARSTPETCDGVDNDRDQLIDEDIDGCEATVAPGPGGPLQEPEPSPATFCDGFDGFVRLTPNDPYRAGANAVALESCELRDGGPGIPPPSGLSAGIAERAESGSGMRVVAIWLLADGQWANALPGDGASTFARIKSGVAAIVIVLA